MSQKTNEILDAALKLLDGGKKWTKGRYEKNGKYCLLGAINYAPDPLGFSYDYFDRERAKDVVYAVLAKRYGPSGVAAFNDAPERTFDEVKELIEEAKQYEQRS